MFEQETTLRCHKREEELAQKLIREEAALKKVMIFQQLEHSAFVGYLVVELFINSLICLFIYLLDKLFIITEL